MYRVHTEVHSLMCRCIFGYPGLDWYSELIKHMTMCILLYAALDQLACTFQLQILVYARVERFKELGFWVFSSLYL
jgi:hypothetical protein